MNVIFTCGGTAGHVNPALALAGYMKKKDPSVNILFVGTPSGMEKGLVEKAGYAFTGVDVSNFHRSIREMGHNLHTAYTLLTSRVEARNILKDFKPDLVVGTGGYASYPMIHAAASRDIPTAVHESNMIPGLTTKLLEGSAQRIMVGFEECREHYKNPEKIVVTGTPVRGDFFDLTPAEARQKLGIADDRPLIVSFWGSLGASGMNAQMMDFFRLERDAGYPYHHIHGCGNTSWGDMHRQLTEAKFDDPALDVRQYIYDMAVVMRAADLVICRAGASTISELTALGMPAVIVPSPYVVANHQEKNARILERHGGAVVITEPQCSGEILYKTVRDILADEKKRQEMAANMGSMGILDATDRIYNTVMALTR